MRTARGLIVSCLLAAVVLSCESVRQKLRSLNSLKHIDFGDSVPKHSLLLLHWFANTVDIDNNDVIHLTFDPNTQDFGSHHYGNYEDLLDPLPRGHVRYSYYTVGNLYSETSDELPDYVRRPPDQDYEGTNRDRIIFRVREQNTGVHTIDQVYLTQHYYPHEDQGTRYNPEHTYQVSTNLLRQISRFSEDSLTELRDHFDSNANNFQFRDFRNTWGEHLACVGLLLFIVIQEKHSRPSNNRPSISRPSKDRPSKDRPSNDRPSNNRPSNNRPSNDRPSNDRPSNNRPSNNTNQSTDWRNTREDVVVNIPHERENGVRRRQFQQHNKTLRSCCCCCCSDVCIVALIVVGVSVVFGVGVIISKLKGFL